MTTREAHLRNALLHLRATMLSIHCLRDNRLSEVDKGNFDAALADLQSTEKFLVEEFRIETGRAI